MDKVQIKGQGVNRGDLLGYYQGNTALLQVFVANPNKPKPILDILLRNQEKLVDFLTKFHTDRSEDEQFNDEKAYLIKQIKELRPSDN